MKSKVTHKKEILKIWVEISETEDRKTVRKSKPKVGSLRSISQTNQEKKKEDMNYWYQEGMREVTSLD